MNIEYACAITILSSIAMWACFRLIERHETTPRANSYMALSQVIAGEGSGFVRFLILRGFPPLIVLIAETSILAKLGASANQCLFCPFVSALIYVLLTYLPSFIHGFTFGEKFLSAILILTYPCIAVFIGVISRYVDFSRFAPSNLQTLIDGIWQTFLVSIVIITFYEMLRNYPDERYIKQDELHDRKVQIVKRELELILCRFKEVIITTCANYDTSPSLLLSILIYEDLNRPQWIRLIENILVRLPGAKLTVGIAQVTSTFPLSDVESIDLASAQLRYTNNLTTTQMIRTIRQYNPSDKYVASILEIKGIVEDTI
ncbi:hypothetical protein [Bifidobacterium moukalabense]|uniref:hypothetical protein n=1 Tax=Bifidobacterium moukalabense TaxID=1333651 RepID=UPI0010F4BF56|nr:hypothetical protein [Bifidobacterium moukalabense]